MMTYSTEAAVGGLLGHIILWQGRYVAEVAWSVMVVSFAVSDLSTSWFTECKGDREQKQGWVKPLKIAPTGRLLLTRTYFPRIPQPPKQHCQMLRHTSHGRHFPFKLPQRHLTSSTSSHALEQKCKVSQGQAIVVAGESTHT